MINFCFWVNPHSVLPYFISPCCIVDLFVLHVSCKSWKIRSLLHTDSSPALQQYLPPGSILNPTQRTYSHLEMISQERSCNPSELQKHSTDSRLAVSQSAVSFYSFRRRINLNLYCFNIIICTFFLTWQLAETEELWFEEESGSWCTNIQLCWKCLFFIKSKRSSKLFPNMQIHWELCSCYSKSNHEEILF